MNTLNISKPLKSLIFWIKKESIYLLKNRSNSIWNKFKKQPKLQLKLIIRFIRDQINALKIKPIYKFIAKIKVYQLSNYESIKGEFFRIYNNLRQFDIQKFNTSSWNENINNLESEFLPFPPFSFLNNPVIRSTMFLSSHIKWIKEELKFIESKVGFNEL